MTQEIFSTPPGRNTTRAYCWSLEELALLREAYSGGMNAPVDLIRLAHLLGRYKPNICRKARALGLTNQRRWKIEGGKKPWHPFFATEEERRTFQGERMRLWIAEHGHPRGALGMKLTEEHKAKMREGSQRAWNDPHSKFFAPELVQQRSDRMLQLNINGKAHQRYTRTSGGKREDLGDTYFRSSWEANYARVLNFLLTHKEILRWEYEPYTFVFEKIKRGTRAYTPDFKVFFQDGHHEWHEVKGWMDPKSKTRLTRMAQFFPEEPLVIIDAQWFKQARRSGLVGLIAHWEGHA